MKKKYCCDSSRSAFEQYYLNQAGNGLPIFQGSRNQIGHGFGSVLGGLFRTVAPILKRFGGQALRTGAMILGDMAQGKKFSDVALQRLSEGINNIIPSENSTPQTGSGRRRSRKRKYSGRKKVRKLKRSKRGDIF